MKVLLLNEIRTANMVLYINRGRKERNESFLYKCWKACEQAPLYLYPCQVCCIEKVILA